VHFFNHDLLHALLLEVASANLCAACVFSKILVYIEFFGTHIVSIKAKDELKDKTLFCQSTLVISWSKLVIKRTRLVISLHKLVISWSKPSRPSQTSSKPAISLKLKVVLETWWLTH